MPKENKSYPGLAQYLLENIPSGITQEELADICTVRTQATIAHWFAGRARPGVCALGILAARFDDLDPQVLAELSGHEVDFIMRHQEAWSLWRDKYS